MLQAALADSQFLDLFPFSDDGLVASEVDVSGCDVVQALVIAFVVVVIDERPDLAFEVSGQIIVFQQYPVLHRLMPAFNFALGLRPFGDASITCQVIDGMARRERDAFSDPSANQQDRQRCSMIRCPLPDSRYAVSMRRAEQARLVSNDGLVAAGCCQSHLDRVCHVLSSHVCAELPCDDVAAVIIQASHGLRSKPLPANRSC